MTRDSVVCCVVRVGPAAVHVTAVFTAVLVESQYTHTNQNWCVVLLHMHTPPWLSPTHSENLIRRQGLTSKASQRLGD